MMIVDGIEVNWSTDNQGKSGIIKMNDNYVLTSKISLSGEGGVGTS